MKFDHILSSHLNEDDRVKGNLLIRKQIYGHPQYELHICVYEGIQGHRTQSAHLVTCMVVYKEQAKRVLFKLWHTDPQQDWDAYIQKYVLDKIEADLKSPLHIVRDAARWCNLGLTESDEITLIEAGIQP